MQRLHALIAISCLSVLCLGIVGCSGDSVINPVANNSDLYWALRLNHRAITMATGDTLKLSAKMLTPSGGQFAGDAVVTYRSTDTTRVFVDSNGVVTGRDPGAGVQIIATARSVSQNTTNADTAYVTVTATRYTLRSFAIAPLDSTILAAGSDLSLTPLVTDVNGQPIPDVMVRYGSASPSSLAIDPLTGSLSGLKLGKTKVWAEATVYGVARSDTVEITVTHPVHFEFDFLRIPYDNPNAPIVLSDEKVTIRLNGTITFWNATAVPISVTFDHTDGIDGGNVGPFVKDDGDQDRKFLKLGTYKFTSSLKQSGKIVVVP